MIANVNTTEFKRVIGRYGTDEKGPLIILVCSIHGNENAGYFAAEKVFEYLQTNQVKFNGKLIAVTGNLEALKNATRFIDEDLNRKWQLENIDFVRNTTKENLKTNEEKEQKILINLFDRLKLQHNGRQMIMIDFHTTSAKVGAFSISTNQTLSQQLALNLKLPVIVGLNKVIESTTLNFFENIGFTALAFEAGNHFDEESKHRIEAAIWVICNKLNCIKINEISNYNKHLNLLKTSANEMPKMVNFLYRHQIVETDNFKMLPGFKNLQPITKNQHLANDKNGKVLSPYSGRILMPLYQKKGNDGFFITKEVNAITQ